MPNILEKPTLGAVGSDQYVITSQETDKSATTVFSKVLFALIAGVIFVSVMNKKLPGN